MDAKDALGRVVGIDMDCHRSYVRQVLRWWHMIRNRLLRIGRAGGERGRHGDCKAKELTACDSRRTSESDWVHGGLAVDDEGRMRTMRRLFIINRPVNPRRGSSGSAMGGPFCRAR